MMQDIMERGSLSETEFLLPKYMRYNRPRISSIHFMVDSWFAGGIITRVNYMTQCFNTVWNRKAGVRCLRYLLWNLKITTNHRAMFALIGLSIQWLIPLSTLLLLTRYIQQSDVFKSLVFFYLILQLLLLVWYIIVLHVIIINRSDWLRSWFTFEVPRGTIGLLEHNSYDGLTLFDNRANIRFLRIEFNRVFQIDHISKIQQRLLIQNMRHRNLKRAEIIIFTDDFIYCYNTWPKMMCGGLLMSTACSLILVYYLLGKV